MIGAAVRSIPHATSRTAWVEAEPILTLTSTQNVFRHGRRRSHGESTMPQPEVFVLLRT